MATSKTDICNLALIDLGAKTVSSIDDDDTAEANACSEIWDLLLDDVLGEHKWDFAKKWDALSALSEYDFVDEAWDYAYQLPADFIRVSMVEDDVDYEQRGNVLLSNTESLNMEYIFRETDTTKYPSHFIAALVARLKIPLSVKIAKRSTRNIDFEARYRQVALPVAKKLDAQGSGKTDQALGAHTADNDPWLAARRSR